jgi:glycosyltransferase involved in cell wall biosynthesis
MAKLKTAIFYGDKRNSGQYDNGVWMDILDIPYIEKLEEAGNYDVIIRTLWLESIGWSKEIRRRFPHVIQIGLSDHPLSTHVSKMAPDRQVAYLQDLAFLDGLMALTWEEEQWYALAVPNIPVVRVGLPFPIDAYTEHYGQYVNNPDKQFIGLGVGASDNDRNFISSALVMNQLRMLYPELQGLYLSLPKDLIAPTSVYAEKFGGIWLHEREGMDGYYDRLSQCKFIINLADRNTPGRLQGEGAFFGVPVIGSDRLELQKELWPDLAVTPYSVGDAAKIAVVLNNDEGLRSTLAQKARKELEMFNYRRSRSRYNRLLKTILEKREVQEV